MAKGGSMTIDEVKKQKIALEKSIFELVKGFETSTRVKVSYIDMIRERPKEEDYEDGPQISSSTSRPLKTVNLNVNFDLLF